MAHIWCYDEITPRVLISRCTIPPIHSYRIHYMISWNDPRSANLTLFNESHTRIWGVSLWYKEITLGVLTSCRKMTPTHRAIRSHRSILNACIYWTLALLKNGNLQRCNTYLRLCSLCYNICIWVMKAGLYYNIIKCLCQCFIHVVQWLPYIQMESHFMTLRNNSWSS